MTSSRNERIRAIAITKPAQVNIAWLNSVAAVLAALSAVIITAKMIM